MKFYIARSALGIATSIIITGAASAKGSSPSGITYYSSGSTKAAGLAFSDAVRAGDVLYLNNQIGNATGKGSLVDGGFKAQFAQIMVNIDGVFPQENTMSYSDWQTMPTGDGAGAPRP